MADKIYPCSDNQLQRLLHSDAPTSDHEELIAHLEGCPHCQSRLWELAASDEDWKHAAGVLVECERASINKCNAMLETSRWNDRPQAWTESMAKGLLSPPSHPEMLGRIGRYDVERLIGCGGMGVVFKAHDSELNRPVAVKLLAPYLATNGSARRRFAREARSAAGVVDDHVVPIFNVESESEPPFLVMQYIAGGSLQDRLDRDGPLDAAEVLRIGLQVAKGLAAAHAQGLIHRDVKPSNILLDEGVERAMLTDFGLARAEGDASLTRSGFHPGTPHYMSPEQIRGESIDGRSDLFGLGCVLYAACAGHPPFRAESSYAVLRRITDESPRPLREVNAGVPEWLELIVLKLLAKSADERYQSAEEVADLLGACLAHLYQPTVVSLPEPVVKLSRHFDRCEKHSAPTESLHGFRFSPNRKLLAVAFFPFLLLAGIFITLETRKGTITIESDVDDVAIVIKRNGEVYDRMTINRDGKSIRVYSGEYEVALNGDLDQIEIRDGVINLQRGKTSVVQICELKSFDAGALRNDSKFVDPKPSLIGTWRLMGPANGLMEGFPEVNITVTFDDWTMVWHTEGDTPVRYLYHPLSDNSLSVFDEKHTGIASKAEEWQYELASLRSVTAQAPHPATLRLIRPVSDTASSPVLEFHRLRVGEMTSTYTSHRIPVDPSGWQNVSTSEVVKTHARMIASRQFLGQIPRRDEWTLVPSDADQAVAWLRQHLIVKAVEGNHVEIGIHGHINSIGEREQIIDAVVDQYKRSRETVSTDATQQTIDRLISERAKTKATLSIVQTRHRNSETHVQKSKGFAELEALLRELTGKLNLQNEELLQYAVPACPIKGNPPIWNPGMAFKRSQYVPLPEVETDEYVRQWQILSLPDDELPTYNGRNIRQWIKAFQNSLPKHDSTAIAECETAIGALRKRDLSSPFILLEMRRLFSDAKRELNPALLDQTAARIIRIGGHRHQKKAIEYLFKIAEKHPAFEAWITLESGRSRYPMDEAIYSIHQWDQGLAKQIVSEMSYSPRRMLGAVFVLLCVGRDNDVADDWVKENAGILHPAFQEAQDDPKAVVRELAAWAIETLQEEGPVAVGKTTPSTDLGQQDFDNIFIELKDRLDTVSDFSGTEGPAHIGRAFLDAKAAEAVLQSLHQRLDRLQNFENAESQINTQEKH